MEQVSSRDASSGCTLCQYLNESPSTKELLDKLQDPTRLSRRLRELSPSKRSACIVGLILRATKLPNKVGLLTSLPESQVLDIMEETRELLEGARGCTSCMTDPEEKTHILRRLLIKLSRNTQMVPRSFLIRGIQLQGSHPVRVGGFADIFQASYQGQLVALKRLRWAMNNPITESEENEFRRKALVSWFLSHPNIQPFLGIDQTTFYPMLCIVSTWQQNGNILDWLNHFKALGLPILVDECIKRILSGVCYLHKNGITHGDLSSKNVLIDGHCNPQLADFGLSTLHGAGSSTMGTRSSGGGTPRFMAPEVLGGSAQSSFAADMYAFACVCIELHTLRHPFPSLTNDFQVLFAVMQGSRPSKPSEPTNSLSGFWETLSQCWNRDPLTRPSADSLGSSLPLQAPALPIPGSAALPHINWTMPVSGFPHSPASDGPSAGHHLHRDLICTLDSCLVGLLDFSTSYGKNVHEMVEQLAALGCPEEVTRFVREGLADEETMNTAERAASLVDLGFRMRDLGRYRTASEYFIQAVGIQRELSTTKPGEFHPLLALSLDSASRCLGRLGEFKDAVKYSLEAVSLRRDLAREKPNEINVPLAASLHDLALCLSNLGELRDAVAYGRQAVDLRQDLSRGNPDEFNAPLADSLHSLAHYFSRLGEMKDAVVYGRQAVDLRQDLARESPEDFNALLALSLHDLAFYFSYLGEWKDAVVHGRQTVDLRQDLARDKPDEFNTPLALSLHDLAFYLSNLEEWTDAVVYSRRAVNLRQALAREEPDEFNIPLALSLHDLAFYLSHLGELNGAVVYGRQAADLRQHLARDNPDEFNALLALSLHDLAYYSSRLGEMKDAMVYSRQAVTIRQDLAQEKPDEFNPLLALSLRDLASYLSQLEEWKDAVVYGRQVTDLYRDLAQKKPDKFNVPLALCLTDLATHSEKLGRHEDVVKFGREAAALFRSLAHEQLESVQERSVFILELLGPSLVVLGFVDEAIEVEQEAKRLERSLGSVSR